MKVFGGVLCLSSGKADVVSILSKSASVDHHVAYTFSGFH